jgi:hypothetical protein
MRGLQIHQRYLMKRDFQIENPLFAYSFIKGAIRLLTLGGVSPQ